ncbi:MAG TPA: TIGR03557 family F420-dependent LLM class oxidoreductase [Thermomicrobiales bacterium]|nr:TIGR03557 family F420-dependent LLM class oxidoreductase [Thermomicrobiales bacterium]
MVKLGYAISSEEFRPSDCVANAVEAEATGFAYALISDHFHPWMDSQGHSPLVWSVLGGIAHATRSLEIGTGVTCPLIRTHPVIIAQAAATIADMMPGRFFLGVGTGEYLNEHITGAQWPPIEKRQDMLVEAVDLIRELWNGNYTTHYGAHYTVENARIYTLPDALPPIHIAASGPESGELAGRHGDGLISTEPDSKVVEAYRAAGGKAEPVYGQMTVCWAESMDAATKTALDIWGYTALPGQLSQELALPEYFQEAAKIVTPELIQEKVVCGPDPQAYLDKIEEYAKAGFTHVYVHQVGPDQAGFFAFAKQHLLPHYA